MDGGYYDNYGVASALDWLAPVIEDRFECDTGLSFRRVLVIQLRSSNPKKRDWDPVSGKGRLVRTGHRHIEFPRPVGSYAQRHRAAPTLEILGAAICRQDGKTSGAISHAGVRTRKRRRRSPVLAPPAPTDQSSGKSLDATAGCPAPGHGPFFGDTEYEGSAP